MPSVPRVSGREFQSRNSKPDSLAPPTIPATSAEDSVLLPRDARPRRLCNRCHHRGLRPQMHSARPRHLIGSHS